MTDTSKEAVERAICNPIIRMVNRGGIPNLDACGLMIDTARTLLAEREALQAQLNSPAHAAKVLLGGIELKYQDIGDGWRPEMSIVELVRDLDGYSKCMPSAHRAQNVMAQAAKIIRAIADTPKGEDT